MSPPPGFKLDIDRVRVELPSRYPTLHLIGTDRGFVLRGSIPIEHNGQEADRFAVEIELNPLEDGDLPKVSETAGRIPRTTDRHMYDDDSCCVCLPADYFFRHPGPFDLFTFLDGPVRDYFIGQALVERGDPWPQGEWAHGSKGRDEWFKEFMTGLSSERADAYLGTLELNELKGHILCPCGSGRRIRTCHYALLEQMRADLTVKQIDALARRARR